MKIAEQQIPPEHMRTVRQIMDEEKLSASHATRMVNALLDSKLWTKKQYLLSKDTGLRRVWHYGPRSKRKPTK
jgi:hypothetical protein